VQIYKYNNSLANEKCHFIAANGFPPEVYNDIFKNVTSVSVQSPLLRPLWNPEPPPILDSWMQFADDLKPYIEKYQPKVVLGHSIGAVIWLLYSIKYNYSFEKIIMIDPALFPRWMYRVYRLIYAFGLQKKFHPLINVTLNRKKTFDSIEKIQESYKQKQIFSRVKENVLQDYINSVFKEEEKGFSLGYSPEWESIIYEKGMLKDRIIWDHLSSISLVTEMIYIKGELSNICTNNVTNRLAKRCSHFYSYEIPNTTHLLPLENPETLVKIINLHLEK
tara:strand:- start:742 stop:1572 length:831 start_codon:yes stop_codon:yes gene_type:complete